jgi:Domain of unknown function (DUF4136)
VSPRGPFAALAVAALAAAALATGCGTSVVSQRDTKARFDKYASYTIEPGPVSTDDAVTAVPNLLVQKRVNESLGKALAAKGLEPKGPEYADLIVTYSGSEGDRQELVRGRMGPVVGLYSGQDLWVQDYREARLVIDVIDANTQKVVWRSTARGLNKTFRDPEFVRKTVEESLAEFPLTRPEAGAD